MQNYFNYFTEIEERFQQRRGSLLMLSTLDWALIETWQEGGVALEAVLRGIDAAFDKYDQRARRSGARARKVNGLAWCAQSVMESVEQAREASVGVNAGAAVRERESGFATERVAGYLQGNAVRLEAARAKPPADIALVEAAARLREMAAALAAEDGPALEEIDRILTVMEEKIFAALMTATSDETLLGLREEAARELAPYRGKMQAVQVKQVQQQMLQKRLLEANGVPRLSLFYMSLQ